MFFNHLNGKYQLQFVSIFVALVLTTQFSIAQTNDPSIAAKEFVNQCRSDPNILIVNPHKETPSKTLELLQQKTLMGGSSLSLYPNDMPRQYVTWKDHKLHGLMQTWYPNGVVMTKEQYRQGKPMEGIYYDTDGVKLGEIKEGNGLKFIFEPPHRGKNWLVATVEYKNGLKDGVEIGYRNYQTKQKDQEAYYKEGKLHGIKTTWMSSGQKNTEEHYRDGIQYGKSICWHENGTIQSVSEYVDGELVDAGVRYYDNGQIESAYEYDKSGHLLQQKEYYANRQIKAITDYNEDTSTKSQVQYFENGTKAEQINDKGHDIWFSSGQLMFSIKKEGRWGKVYSGESFDRMGNPNGKVTDGNGALIKTFISDIMKETTLIVYKNGRTEKTIKLPKLSVALGYDNGGSRIDLKLDFTASVDEGWEKGRFTVLLPDKCSSNDQLEHEINQLDAGQTIKYNWMAVEIPQPVEQWSDKILADIEGVIEGHPVRYQQVIYNSTLMKTKK